MTRSVRALISMARLQRRIAVCLAAGASLSSPKVVALSQLLDRLVLEAYRAG